MCLDYLYDYLFTIGHQYTHFRISNYEINILKLQTSLHFIFLKTRKLTLPFKRKEVLILKYYYYNTSLRKISLFGD